MVRLFGRARSGRGTAAGDAGREAQRRAMVEEQLARRGIRDEAVLRAMGEVPREAFLEPPSARAAYEDRAVAIGEGQSISQPYVVARMTELLRVRPGDRILEVGTGSGYQAAVLAAMGARVRTIERHASLAAAARARFERLGIEGVDVVGGDGSIGSPDGAPWDGIVVTAAAPAVPAPLRGQLRVGARLVVPVGGRWDQVLLVVERVSSDEWRESNDGAVVFVPLIGEAGWEG